MAKNGLALEPGDGGDSGSCGCLALGRGLLVHGLLPVPRQGIPVIAKSRAAGSAGKEQARKESAL